MTRAPNIMVLRDAAFAPVMVSLPAGCFMMGSDKAEPGAGASEMPRHEVRLARDFAIGRFAVTFDEFDAFCHAAGRERPEDEGWGRGRRPVVNVSWQDAVDYCIWLTGETGAQYRLPSESEWEYAARAGTESIFSFGDLISADKANYDSDYIFNGSGAGGNRQRTVEVGALPANPWGLHEVHGNVFEWCADDWHKDYDGWERPDDGTPWLGGEKGRAVIRGSSWMNPPQLLRSAFRDWFEKDDRDGDIGLRVVREV